MVESAVFFEESVIGIVARGPIVSEDLLGTVASGCEHNLN